MLNSQFVSLSCSAASCISLLRVSARTSGCKEYVTVGQLNQMYGMPKVESSPTSPAQLLQSSLTDSAFSCLPSPHGSSLSLSFEVCLFKFSTLCFLKRPILSLLGLKIYIYFNHSNSRQN